MRTINDRFIPAMDRLKDVPLLFFRLILAYGFFQPAMMKITGLTGVAEWFGSMGYPLPVVSAFLAALTEGLGVVLLTLGLGTRYIAIPLMFVMGVAVLTVHLSNGFAAGDNGFEIPLYYFLMLFALVVYGSGRFSLDHFFSRNR